VSDHNEQTHESDDFIAGTMINVFDAYGQFGDFYGDKRVGTHSKFRTMFILHKEINFYIMFILVKFMLISYFNFKLST
jgi:hypothetical protein